MFKRKSKEKIPELPPLPSERIPPGFKQKYGSNEPDLEPDEEIEEEVIEKGQWELIEIPPIEKRFIFRNNATGEEIEATYQRILEYLNNL